MFSVSIKKRTVGLLPPPVRKLLSVIGNEKITSIKIVRTPLESFVTKLLGVLSLGTFQKAVKESNYDNMFHLALFINNSITLDKQAVIKMVKGSPIKSKSQVMDIVNIDIASDLTYTSLLDKTRVLMGDGAFSNYNAKTNNCQDFIISILRANSLLNTERQQFIKQDAESVFRKMPSITEKLANIFTDVGAIADVVIEGQGSSLKRQIKKPNVIREQWFEIEDDVFIPKPLYGTGPPYQIYKNGDKCYTLINTLNGKVHGYCMEEEKAKKQYELLERWHFEEKNKLSNNKKMETWREFWTKSCKGKKFPGGRAEINQFMKEKAKEYRELKGKSK